MSETPADAVRAAVLLAQSRERAGDLAGAIGALRRALELRPDLAAAHAQLGALLLESGDARSAAAHLGHATRLKPGDARAWNNLSAASMALASHAEAESAARRALAIDAGHKWAHFNLGRALLAQRRRDEGRAALREAVRISPENALAWELLGDCLVEEGRLEQGREALARSTQADPARASAWSRLGSAFLHSGRTEEAIDAMTHAEALAPPDAAQIGSTRLIALHYDASRGRDEIFGEHVEWAKRYAPAALPQPFSNARGGERRLRIGYVSPRFHRSALAHLLEPVLRSHDPGAVETWCYSTQAVNDEVTQRLRSSAAQWVDASALDDAALAARIRADGIDIAVDLAGHTPGHRLLAFARKPAPVCVTWLDYFDTTGLASMDYFVTDAGHSPHGDGQRFTERLIRLPRVRFCYEAPEGGPEVLPPPLARGAKAPVLASFNRSAKLSAATLGAWRLALDAIPGARLIVKNSSLDHEEERAALGGRLARAGIDVARVELRGFSSHRRMLEEYNEADIVLDTFPYNGGVTTLEAMWMGRPVATIRGDTLISRQGAALLGAMGMDELAAADSRDFARLVAGLAADPQRLASLSRGMRQRLEASPLMDARGLASVLEGAYREAWKGYLARESG